MEVNKHMNYLKIQQDLLKNAIKQEAGFLFGECSTETGNCIGVSKMGHVVWLIPKKYFMLDLDKLDTNNVKKTDISRWLDKKPNQSKKAFMTTDLKRTGKNIIAKIEGGGVEAWVDTALLKYFDNPDFGVTSPTGVIEVFEDDKLVGLVCPVRV